ncbi:hypothetical protein MLD38_034343 [Melastoma candidum]|uniref:Uncharacterized protein n=1 Tax=Melastoma candidum TaxID=119954 RepID=A0ACB9MB04_9MYRT|nr:hypothetical protein MLD38_034343 [Melastoma candidum]
MAAAFDGSWLVLLLIATSFAISRCVDDKCAACEAVAGELEIGLSNDGLCEKMQDYTLEKRDSSKQEWVKVHDWVDFVVGLMRRMVFQTRLKMTYDHIGLRSMAVSC